MYAAGKMHIPNGSYKGTLIADPFSVAAIDCNFRLKMMYFSTPFVYNQEDQLTALIIHVMVKKFS